MNLRDLMNQVTELIGGESEGHKFKASCIINKDKEEAFIELVKKKLVNKLFFQWIQNFFLI